MAAIRDKTDGSSSSSRGRHRRRVVIVACLVAAVIALGAGAFLWFGNRPQEQPSADPGATIQSYDDSMSDDEIRRLLDERTEASRMTISVAPTVYLKDGRARVNVLNDGDNRFSQSFTLEQDGTTLYQSGYVDPGSGIEWCDARGAHEGEATLTVQALDAQSHQPSGNPQSVAVTLKDMP